MENIKRIITSVIGIPLVIALITFGNIYLIDVVIAIVAIISLYEYFNAFKEYKPIKWIAYLLAASISCIHIITPISILPILITISIPCIITIMFIQLVIKDLKISIIDIAITLFGIAYIVLFLLFVPLMLNAPHGRIFVWYVFIVAWGTDIFAYIIGRRFGKHKFSKISPNKSIEGCLAGIIGSVICSLIYTLCVNKILQIELISYLYIVMISMILSVIGQFGDFAASSIKRFVGIKDFGNLIPGHGGILDRIDSLIFIAPFAYILLMLI